MSAGPNARLENRRLYQSAPVWARMSKPLFIVQHRLRRLIGGMYLQRPFSYDIFTAANPEGRTRYDVGRPVGRAKAGG